jgi:hypothetical protein
MGRQRLGQTAAMQHPDVTAVVAVPVYRGMKRNDAELMNALPRVPPLGRRSATNQMDALQDELAAEARVLVRIGKKVVETSLAQLPPDQLRRTAPVRRLGSYDKARSNLALHPVERDGFRSHVWAESQLELAHLRELQRERRFDWYDTQRCVLYWLLPRGRYVWHVPDIAAVDVDGRPWLMNVKNHDDINNSAYVRAQLMLTAATCAHAGWGYRVLSDMSPQHQALLSALRQHRRELPVELTPSLNSAVLGRGKLFGEVVQHAGGRPGGHVVAMHLLASGLLDADLNRSLEDWTPVVWQV